MTLRAVDPLTERRITAWLDREMVPPVSPRDMTDREIGEVLEVMAGRGELFDGTSIWLCEAAGRLRRLPEPSEPPGRVPA